MTQFRTNVAPGVLRGIGLDDIGAAVFTLGETMPTLLNSGVPTGTILTPYDADITTARTITVTVPGTVFEDIDFGNIRVDVRAANVTFRRCRWIVTQNRTTTPMVRTDQIVAGGNCVVEFCTIDNRDQNGYQFNAVQGHDVTVYRSKILGTVDGIRPNLGGNVRIWGNFIGFLGWWGTETGKPTLNSGFQTHSDCIQTTFAGVSIIGNSLWGYPSTIVGTGTPGNGTDSGNPDGWYTQSQSNTRRAALITTWTDATKSADGVSHQVNTYITPLMCNVATGSTALNLTVTDNWIAGGGLQVNALATNLTAPLGTFHRNRHYNDAGTRSGGNGVGYRLRYGLDDEISTSGRLPLSGDDRNTYVDSGATVGVSRPAA